MFPNLWIWVCSLCVDHRGTSQTDSKSPLPTERLISIKRSVVTPAFTRRRTALWKKKNAKFSWVTIQLMDGYRLESLKSTWALSLAKVKLIKNSRSKDRQQLRMQKLNLLFWLRALILQLQDTGLAVSSSYSLLGPTKKGSRWTRILARGNKWLNKQRKLLIRSTKWWTSSNSCRKFWKKKMPRWKCSSIRGWTGLMKLLQVSHSYRRIFPKQFPRLKHSQTSWLIPATS